LNIKKDEKAQYSTIAIIPAYNEEKNISMVIKKCKKYVNNIIVIDDASIDSTPIIAEDAGATVIINKENIGKTGSLKKGFNKGLKEGVEIFVLLDGDGQHNPQEIPLFLKKIKEGYDLVIGARKFQPELMPTIRIFANTISSYIVSLISGVRIKDSQSGFRAVKREILERISLTSTGYQSDTEMIVKAARCGYKIGFVPISTIYHPEARSKVNQIIDPIKFLILLVKLAFLRNSE
jgi:glycosyltransferase involved in cell wall biosynthesis